MGAKPGGAFRSKFSKFRAPFPLVVIRARRAVRRDVASLPHPRRIGGSLHAHIRAVVVLSAPLGAVGGCRFGVGPVPSRISAGGRLAGDGGVLRRREIFGAYVRKRVEPRELVQRSFKICSAVAVWSSKNVRRVVSIGLRVRTN